MLERIRILGLKMNLLKMKDDVLQVIVYGDGLIADLDYFCGYTVNGRTRITPAVVDFETKVLTCQTDFIQTRLYRCHKVFVLDSNGNEFHMDGASRLDEVCFIEQIDIEGHIHPHLIPRDATYERFEMRLTEESKTIIQMTDHLIHSIELQTANFNSAC